MSTNIVITIAGREIEGILNDGPTASAIASMLPITVVMSRWGEEYYGGIDLEAPPEPGARDVVAVGELAYWPPGDALCLFFGPTPVSRGAEPRAASPVNPVGAVEGDISFLRTLGHSISVTVRAR
ncbi:MAG: hypothetical protein MI724_01475 [Spirochaetales bacterium]|nr:hypothetical protein [Spirochaetales bacterium]